ncbi:MAG TPA: taurine catabolism dioxygenase TauD, partial [Rhizobiales bacterium]|nr:taurine catabolism dioxygenase TauD [Hyphomicrobiales bacterium]
DASKGGESELLDPEIAYIRLRDENPDFIAAMMHPKAMIIPANNDPRSDFRPDSIGPVFETDPVSGHLNMRYTARSRNIIWRDDPVTTQARSFLTAVLQNDPLIVRHKLKSGQGIISNNVLHNRTGFIDASDDSSSRLLYRIRYKERVSVA